MRRDPDRYRGALLSRAQWLAIGHHARDLAGPEFTSVFSGYLTPTDHPATLNAMAFVLQNHVLPGCVISHTTAALLHGIALPWPLEDGIGFLAPKPGDPGWEPWETVQTIPAVRPDRSLRTGAELPTLHARIPQGSRKAIRRGVHVHRWEPGPVERLDRLLVSTVPEVLRELATMIPLFDLVAAADSALSPQRPGPVVAVEDIARHLTGMRGHRGAALLHRALRLVRTEVRSPGESLLRMLVVDAGLPEPDPNLPVVDPVTGRRRLLDLAWKDAMFALEYDGDEHRTTKGRWREDENRRDELSALGWTLARANGDDLQQPERILVRAARALRERGLEVPGEDSIRAYAASLPARDLTLHIRRRSAGR